MSTTAEDDAFEAAPCGLLLTDEDDRITRVNDTFLAWTGHRREELLGTPFASLLAPGSQAFYATQYQDELWSRGEAREIAMTGRRPDGGELPLLVNARTIGPRGAVTGVRLAVFDATRRQDFEREMLDAKRTAESSEAAVRMLQEAGSLFLTARTQQELARQIVTVTRSAFAAVHTAVVTYEDDGSSYRIVEGAPLEGLIGAVRRSRDDGAAALGPEQLILIHDIEEAYARSEESGDRMRELRAAAYAGVPITDGEEVMGAFVCLFGRPRRFEAALLEQIRAVALQMGLALARVRLLERLRHLANHDQLTGAINRAALDERVSQVLEAARILGTPTSLIFFDLDGFKAVNDGLGHRAGDRVLQIVAERTRAAVRAGDTVGRFGGDEFLVVCDDATAEEAVAVGRRIAAAVALPIGELPGRPSVTASIGVASHDPTADADMAGEALIRRADDAMYEAKRRGRDRIAVG